MPLDGSLALHPDPFAPQPGPQTALLDLPPAIEEAVLGGARGGGKTYAMLLDFLKHAGQYGRHAAGIFFRRRTTELKDAIRESFNVYPATGARWRGDPERGGHWRWGGGCRDGARLEFGHLWDTADATARQGHSYSWICCEELTNWPVPEPVEMIMACLRSAHGVAVAFRASCNPGGPGHNWVKARYVDPAPSGYVPIRDAETGRLRVFIPARLEDNRILLDSDPGYEGRVIGAAPAHLRKGWRWGDWNVVAGGFFDDVWNPARHVLPYMPLPAPWWRSLSFDWGSAKPSSLGLWAEADGSALRLGAREWRIPRGSLIRTNEWYTVARKASGEVEPNVGLRLTNDKLGEGIAMRAGATPFRHNVADPSIFSDQGGPSIYDQIVAGARKADWRLVFDRADNSRAAGWQRMRDMLVEAAKDVPEGPGLYVMENCADFIRTVPVLTRSARDPDDVDTDAEDHAADETRYRVMTRPKRVAVVKTIGH